MSGRVCYLAQGLAGGDWSIKEPAAVLVDQGRIVVLGSSAMADQKAQRQVLPGLWLSPAPMDAHVHLWLGGLAPDNLAASARAGLAGVRDLGHSIKKTTPSQEPDTPPCLSASGRGLTCQGPGANWLGEPLAGPPALADAARQRIADGATVIKLFGTGLLDFERVGQVTYPLSLSQEEMAAACQVAAQAGCQVTVHASGRPSVAAAVAAGVNSIEHGFFLEPADFGVLASAGVAWTPTLAPVIAHMRDTQERHTPEVRSNWGLIAQGQRQALSWALQEGVRLVLGSDAGSYGVPHGQAAFLEMQAWLEAGVPPQVVFEAATKHAARSLGQEGELGVLAPGARAWLLGTAGDPRQDPLLWQKATWRSF